MSTRHDWTPPQDLPHPPPPPPPPRMVTGHAVVADAPPPYRNLLGAEVRQILADVETGYTGAATERLLRLAEHVERLGDQPVEVDASTELTVNAGLEPEQTIRDYAIGHVIERHAVNGAHLLQSQLWVQADVIAAYIRDGSRPDTAEEATTHAH